MLFRFLTLFTFSLTSMSMTVIDVRTKAEWNTGHLEGALRIEWQDILKVPSDIQKDEEIFLYCMQYKNISSSFCISDGTLSMSCHSIRSAPSKCPVFHSAFVLTSMTVIDMLVNENVKSVKNLKSI